MWARECFKVVGDALGRWRGRCVRRVRCVVDDLVVCRNCIGDGRRFEDALCVGKRREKDDVEATCFCVCVARWRSTWE